MLKAPLIVLLLASALLRICHASLWDEFSTKLWDSYGQLQDIFHVQRAGERHETLMFSQDPLVIYIPSFITPQEAAELASLSQDKFQLSPLYSDSGEKIHDPNYRSSLTATLPVTNIVSSIHERARSLSFYNSAGAIKPLVVQKYALGNQYKDHYDWFFPHPSLTGNIESTIFVYIQANCTGGGTNFPRLTPMREGSEGYDMWCEYVDCDAPYEDGVTFKPIVGNAVYWKNVDAKGKGLTSTLHAGLPVTSGDKMGLNIWTWVVKE